MIESSTKALALNCEFMNIFLPDSILSNKHFFKQLLDIKNLNINKINFLDKSFLKFGLLSKHIKNKIDKADIVFVHNSKLLKVLRSYFPKKKIILFFHTDKIKQFHDFKFANKVLTVNKTMENKINSLYSNKASYLPNASYKLLEKKKSKHQSKNFNRRSRFVIGSMGRLVKKKGFDFLIKVCAEICRN